MNLKQTIFAEKYKETGNAKLSALFAGYKETTAGPQSVALLKRPDIQAYLTQHKQELALRTNITVERVLQEVARIAFADTAEYYNPDGSLKAIDDLTPDQRAAIASIEVFEEYQGWGKYRTAVGTVRKLKLWDKTAALEKLMKHLGLYKKDNDQTRPLVQVHIEKQEVLLIAKQLEQDI